MKLYQLSQQYNAIKEMDLDEEVIQDTLEALQGDIEDKADNITKLIRELELSAEAKKAEANRLWESAASDLKKSESLKKYLEMNLIHAGIKKIDTGLFKIGFLKGREVVEVDESKLPDNYWKVEEVRKPMSKTDLKVRLKSGVEIDGVKLTRKPDTLQIK